MYWSGWSQVFSLLQCLQSEPTIGRSCAVWSTGRPIAWAHLTMIGSAVRPVCSREKGSAVSRVIPAFTLHRAPTLIYLLSKCWSVGSGSHIDQEYFYVIIIILLMPKGHYLNEKITRWTSLYWNGSGISLGNFFYCFSTQYILETVRDIFSIKLTSKNNFHGTILSALFTYCIFPDQTWCRVFELFIVCLLANCICDKQTRAQTHKHTNTESDYRSDLESVGHSLVPHSAA
jgi:hypothetical protein